MKLIKVIVGLIIISLLLIGCENYSASPVTPSSDTSETTSVPHMEMGCLTVYRFQSLSDFYLYAEQYETDVEKYEYLEGPPAGYGVPPYQLAVPLIKLEDVIPEFHDTGLQIDRINVFNDNHYIYFFDQNISVTVIDRYTDPGDIKIQTDSSEYILLTKDNMIYSIKYKIADGVYLAIRLPIDATERAVIAEQFDVPVIKALLSGNLIDIEKATATVKQNVIEKLAERYSES